MLFSKTLDAACRVAACVTVVIALAVTATGAAMADQQIKLLGQVNSEAMRAQAVGRTDASKQINIAITLNLRNEQDLDNEIQSLYDPSSPNYHKFLTPAQFNAKYAPTQGEYNAVLAFAAKNGLTVTGTHANRQVIDVSGPASTVENAFSVHLLNRVDATGRSFYAADAQPSLPGAIASTVQSVIGLDNASVFKPHITGQKPLGLSRVVNHAGSGPDGLLEPNDINKAYNLNGLSENGTGQTLALFELDGYATSDIQMYENQFGLPNVPLQNVLVDGWNGSAGTDGGNVEVCLDIELMIAVAPHATKILVYEAPNDDQAVVDLYSQIASDDLAQSVSSSWGMAEIYSSNSFLQAEQTAFKQMATQGQSVYAAAGDSGAYDSGSNLAVDDPASQPYVCGVGGTSLTTTSSQAYSSETTWGYGSEGGGGGKSVVWSKPSYQTGLGLSSTMRDVPDVSLDADPNTGYVIACDGGWYALGGTSCAAPLWAGFTALVNQARAQNNAGTLGFPNPTLYALGRTGAYFTDFHDVADNSNNLYYIAVPGYDDATGLGTFNGANLLNDLSTGSSFSATAPAPPTNVLATVGSSSTAVTWTASSGATSYNVLRGTSTSGPFLKIGTSSAASYTDSNAGSGSSYTYVITAQGSGGISGNSNVSGKGTTTAVPPTGLAASAILTTSCNLNCNPVIGASSYVIGESSKTGGPYTQISTPPTDATTIINLTPATTYYFVEAAMVAGKESGWSNEVKVVTTLNSPGNTAATAASNGSMLINLSWSAPTGGAKGYVVKRSTTNGGSYSQIATTTTALTYADSNISPGVAYFYVIDATANGVTSADSRQVEASAGIATPTGFVANYSSNGVYMHCNTVTGATGFTFYKGSAAGGPWTQIGTSANNGYTYTSPTMGATTYYACTASNGPSKSGYSNSASCLTPPPVPTGLKATASTSGVSLSWSFPTGLAATTFSVIRATSSGGSYGKVGTASSDSFVDTGAARGTTYYYEVYATNNAGSSADSSPVTVTTTAPIPSAPAAPHLTLSGTNVVVSWSSVTNATSYKLYRAASPSTGFTLLATSSSTSFTDTTTKAGTSYSYTVAASGTGGTSPNGNSASITVPLPAPNGVAVTSTGISSIAVKWNAVSGATSYSVGISTHNGASYTFSAATASTSGTATALNPATTYYLVVVARTSTVSSPNSSQVSSTTTLTSPSSLTASTNGAGSVNLRWSGVSGASSYVVSYSITSGSGYQSGATGSSTSSTSTTISGLNSGTTYYFIVSAHAGSAASGHSNQAAAATGISAPSAVAANPASSSAVSVSWSASTGARAYTVYRSTNPSKGFAAVSSTSSTRFSSTGLNASTRYYYYVTAAGTSATSAPSPTANATTQATASNKK